jgi:hypothetical protein
MKAVDFAGRTLTQIQAQNIFDWSKDERGAIFWEAMKDLLATAQDKALSLEVDHTIHPEYTRKAKDEECGKANAYLNTFALISELAENIAETHRK